MYQSFYQGSAYVLFPVGALLLFVALFAGVVLRVLRGGADRARFDEAARLPFADGESVAGDACTTEVRP